MNNKITNEENVLKHYLQLDEEDRVKIWERIDILLEDEKYKHRYSSEGGVIHPNQWS